MRLTASQLAALVDGMVRLASARYRQAQMRRERHFFATGQSA
jgi:hypothetical protein